MRTWNKRFIGCLLGTLIFAFIIIFLPRFLSKELDKQKLNRVEFTEREHFSFLEQSPESVLDTAKAFQHLHTDEENLLLISEFTDTAKINTELLEAVYDQAMTASELGLIPFIGSLGYELAAKFGLEVIPNDYWADQVMFARNYSLTYTTDTETNSREMLNFWYLRFSDGKTFDYYFIVNAVTYQIYYAEIYNQYTDYAAKAAELLYFSDGTIAEIPEVKIKSSVPEDLYNKFYWYQQDLYYLGCIEYYQPDDAKLIYGSMTNNKLSIVVLNYGNEAVYIEQLCMPDNAFPYRGISIGLQNLGSNLKNALQ